MKHAVVYMLSLAFFCSWLGCPLVGSCGTLPPYPLMNTRVQPSSHEQEKALALFRLARKENNRLEWDACLARKAFMRAREMVKDGYFAHRDPKTGDNPAWEKVAQCDGYRYAAENLVKGYESAEAFHKTLIQSPTHRANMTNPRHRFLGVGCYDHVCVQLFAGL